MTQERMNAIFETDLGQQLNELYVTFDDHIFIRYSEAVDHLSENGYPPENNIKLWFPD